jgi:hypothetical protein
VKNCAELFWLETTTKKSRIKKKLIDNKVLQNVGKGNNCGKIARGKEK